MQRRLLNAVTATSSQDEEPEDARSEEITTHINEILPFQKIPVAQTGRGREGESHVEGKYRLQCL